MDRSEIIPESGARLDLLMHTRAHRALAVGDRERARAALDLVSAAPLPRVALELAHLERRLGRFDRAELLFRRAEGAITHDARAQLAHAQVLLLLATDAALAGEMHRRAEHLRSGRALLLRVLTLDADREVHGWAWFELGRLLRAGIGSEAQALSAFQRAFALLPDEPAFEREKIDAGLGSTDSVQAPATTMNEESGASPTHE